MSTSPWTRLELLVLRGFRVAIRWQHNRFEVALHWPAGHGRQGIDAIGIGGSLWQAAQQACDHAAQVMGGAAEQDAG